MKYIILPTILITLLFACSRENSSKQNELLKSDILRLQKDIRLVSNELEAYNIQGLNYKDAQVREKINDFTEKRSTQSTKILTLKKEYSETADIETIVCGDFESLDCFIENWDIRRPAGCTVEITKDCSYNNTSSLKISVPFKENTFNIPGVEIEGFVNGIEAKTIYKIRFWMKYSGTSDLSNGPLVHMIVTQDGNWLDHLYEGIHETNKNKVVDEDWRLYSFQISTITDSPLELILGTNLENVCVDDIHVVKKD